MANKLASTDHFLTTPRDLEPCPFCANTKFQRNTKAKGYHEKHRLQRAGKPSSNHLIRCTRCGAKGPLSHSVEEAEATWNERPGESAELFRLRADSERLQNIESQTDGGRFDEWSTETFAGQLRMQSRDSLDPEYSQFMAATATHLGILSGQYDAQREIAERAKEEASRLRAHCEAMAKGLETAERQISAAFKIIHPGKDDLREMSLESVRDPLAAYRKEYPDADVV
ncbi:hypothetical protein WBP07_17795 [Novosphingobium sp. BL-8A]|uniref:hypothetical protein n=1 Tax=Novosphingobium sp. BL-8A TaxID=3127639 RepID=UPI0037578D41